MTILFSNYSPKIPKPDFFGHKFRNFCFSVKFCKQANLRVLISNITMVFLKFLPKNTQIRQFFVKNTQIRHFWSQIQAFLFFREILQLFKFKGVDFKYDNSFLKFQPKNTQTKHSWSKILKNGFFDPKFRHFCFFTKICIQANSKVLKFQPKNTRITHFWF